MHDGDIYILMTLHVQLEELDNAIFIMLRDIKLALIILL